MGNYKKRFFMNYTEESQKKYDIGDTIIPTKSGEDIVFDVVDFDSDGYVPTNPQKPHTMMLLSHDVYAYGTIPFSPPQLLCYFVNGLPIGKYRFTLDHARRGSGTEYNGTYMFEIAQAIPAKGGFRHTNIGSSKSYYAKSDVIGNYLTTYNPTATGGAELESNRHVAVWDGDESCVDLGTFTAQNRTYYTEALSITIGGTTYTGNRNFTERNAYGSNRWRDSVYRQWLNSDAEAVSASDTSTISNWWKPATVFDRVPDGAKLAGYLYGMDVDFVKTIGEVAVKTVLHPCDRVGSETFDITYDKIFLASRKNIFGTDEFSGLSEGELFEYFRNATNADRIKYQSGTARYWWLRTPSSGFVGNVRYVNTDGGLISLPAGNVYGVVPACCFTSDKSFKKTLPPEFQEVEYIQSTGTQYIDTEVLYPKTSGNVEIEVEAKLTGTRGGVVGHHNANGSAIYLGKLTSTSTNTKVAIKSSKDVSTNLSILYFDDVIQNKYYNIYAKFDADNLTLIGTVDGVTQTGEYALNSMDNETPLDYNIMLFTYLVLESAGRQLLYFGEVAIKRLKIKTNGILVRNYKSCYRKADNEIGLYDLANGVFYTNQGIGDFLIGGETIIKDFTNGVVTLNHEGRGNKITINNSEVIINE